MSYSNSEEQLIEYINKNINRDYKNSTTLEQVKEQFSWCVPNDESLIRLGVTLAEFYFIKGWILYIQESNKKLINKDYLDTLGNVIKENDWVLLFDKDNNPQKWSAEKVVDNNGILSTVFHKTFNNIYTDLRTIPSNMLVIITTGGENQIFTNDSKIILK